MEWLKQLSRALDYIEDNLTGEISYEEAAQIACCSTYYFQRMFSYVAGIPLSEYIRRRRMTAAAFDLQTRALKVMEVGLRYGYDSPTSFNRAFQSVHGVSPTQSRIEGTKLNAYPRLRFTINVSGDEGMRYRIETKGPLRIVGVRIPLQEDQAANFQIVPRFWEETLKESERFLKIGNLSNPDHGGILGVTVYQSPEEIYYYIGAATDQATPEDLVEYQIPAATWVIFEGEGQFRDSIQTIFKRFLTEWLPFSGYKYAQLPDIEVYPIGNPRINGGHSEVRIAVTNGESYRNNI